MDTNILAMIGFRIASLVLAQQGKIEEAKSLNALSRAIQAGRNVDDHMGQFAELLGTDNEPGMQELVAELNAQTDAFLSRGSDGQLP